MLARFVAAAAVCVFAALSGAAQTKLLRFPDVHGDRVVFTFGGDLWTASTSGGTAVRLTAHPGVETYAKFSPDGKWIAFTGQYDGDEQVYIMPAGGGEPKQLTFYPARGPLTPRWGFDNQVGGWTKDGKVYFRSLRDSWTLGIARLYTVSPQGGAAEPLPMPEAGSGAFSPDSTKMVYSPRFRDFRPEKRYAGGQANTLYIFDLQTSDTQKISDSPFASRDAMWIGNTVYYITDKDGKFNLYAYDTGSKKTTQVTRNRDWDIRWPSSDDANRIIYERNGELELMDVGSKKVTPLSITVPDDGFNKRPRQISVANRITWWGDKIFVKYSNTRLFALIGIFFISTFSFAQDQRSTARNEVDRSSNPSAGKSGGKAATPDAIQREMRKALALIKENYGGGEVGRL